MKTITLEGKQYEVDKCACQHCGNYCDIEIDKTFGPVSECHGCGIGFDDKDGNLITINDDLAYISEWTH